jgi:L-alanine-DL-glutamate epimerase-like enolase superfamily enzyme
VRITAIETFVVDAVWRPWIFVKVETDEGVTGYGECSDARSPSGVVGTIEDLKPLLIGQDPRAFECCQSAKVGRIGTRENYCYGEPALSPLAAEL